MSRALTVELSDELYAVLQSRAASAGTSPVGWVAATVERQLAAPPPSARRNPPGSVRKHFGAVSSGAPIASDNDALDAMLGREYADNHEDG